MKLRVILDPCSGPRMMYFDTFDPRVIFGDIRRETVTVSDQSHGKAGGTRVIEIAPDTEMDFRNLPFRDGSFKLVVFDPPHLVRAGPKSWLAAKYGKLSDNWQQDLAAGFAECFRVLEPGGVLIFKWNETQILVSEILKLTPEKPIFGHKSGKQQATHWMCFMKGEKNEPL
jgi:SAM-dependent methyltransferase